MATDEQIRQALTLSAEEGEEHPATADLLALHRGQLDGTSEVKIREHLERCRVCTALYLEAEAFLEAERRLEREERAVERPLLLVVWRQAALLLLGVGLGVLVATVARDRDAVDEPVADPAVVESRGNVRIYTVRLYGIERTGFSFVERPEGLFQVLLDPDRAPEPGTMAVVRARGGEEPVVARSPVYLNEGIGTFETTLRGSDLTPGSYSIRWVTPEGVETDEPLLFQVFPAEP